MLAGCPEHVERDCTVLGCDAGLVCVVDGGARCALPSAPGVGLGEACWRNGPLHSVAPRFCVPELICVPQSDIAACGPRYFCGFCAEAASTGERCLKTDYGSSCASGLTCAGPYLLTLNGLEGVCSGDGRQPPSMLCARVDHVVTECTAAKTLDAECTSNSECLFPLFCSPSAIDGPRRCAPPGQSMETCMQSPSFRPCEPGLVCDPDAGAAPPACR